MSALRRQRPQQPLALEARVSDPDPDALTVTIDDFDGDVLARHAWEVASWPRTPGAVPARGDRCLVVMSEIGRPWVVSGEWTGEPEPVVPRDWRSPEFVAGWTNHAAADPRFVAGYAQDLSGFTMLRGIVSRATDEWVADTPMLVLPRGFRPSTRRMFITFGYAGAVPVRMRVDALPDGEVRFINAGAAWARTVTNLVGLDGISYWAED
ncbi:hypothetical protein [Conexibacter woesei]|uniref:Uncharacterized protein n=1 Tax=Conexibacter woesei (strain DSM 14684 / CCUG 47730 / CIP 108061 / JCM 11494 / NBRC 100937 / ID131577) TaxID=469383 RepID=D3F1Z7_CONWI|nr:hypothetical protein [Conexibacter woesei]ADB50172.1 hypothetical protein Cwoe_1745 [Conexibacter woesei DSM 14684]